jgi:EAL domain-containing protein (putative c-di-GMP-specific phosphodiesterase class I)
MHVMLKGCEGCRDGAGFDQPFSMAFQPIVDITRAEIFAHEALVRGVNGEGAQSVLLAVDVRNRYAFDQQCRVKAIELASKLGLAEEGSSLSINFMPNAVYEPRACIRLTLAAAVRAGFPINRIIFEFTEDEKLDTNHLLNILRSYRAMGFRTAIDDFGAGHAGLNLLADYQPDIVKLDMALIRGIDGDPVRRRIVEHLGRLMDDLGIVTIYEGVETAGELAALKDIGARYIQGYVLARPAFEAIVPAAQIGFGDKVAPKAAAAA